MFLVASSSSGLVLHKVLEYMPLVSAVRGPAHVSTSLRATTLSSPIWQEWCESTHNNCNRVLHPFFAYVAFRRSLNPQHRARRPPRVNTGCMSPGGIYEDTGGILSPVSMVAMQSNGSSPRFPSEPSMMSPSGGNLNNPIPLVSGTNEAHRVRKQRLQDFSITLTLLCLMVRVALLLSPLPSLPSDATTVGAFLFASAAVHSVLNAPAADNHYLYAHYAFTWLSLLLFLLRYTFRCCIPPQDVRYCLVPVGMNFLSCGVVLGRRTVAALQGLTEHKKPNTLSSVACAVMVPFYMTLILVVLLTDPSKPTAPVSWFSFLGLLPVGILSLFLWCMAFRGQPTIQSSLRQFFPAISTLNITTFVASVLAAGSNEHTLSLWGSMALHILHGVSAGAALLTYIVQRTKNDTLLP
jgi:hypothetical protein